MYYLKSFQFLIFYVGYTYNVMCPQVEEVTKENSNLKCEILRQRQPIVTNINEPSDMKQQIRPVSMYETREISKSDIKRNTHVNTIFLTYYKFITLLISNY